MEAVKSIDLRKTYQGKETIEALKGVNISIEKGELFTLLGPNGAEKPLFRGLFLRNCCQPVAKPMF